MNIWRAAADLATAGTQGALATIARARGSTPVPAGTKMLVGPEGRLLGSVGGAIARAASAAGFRVVVIDDRPEYADPARFDPGAVVLAADVATALVRYPLTEADAVVIATRGHRNDAEILERVATSAAGYVGLLGSRRNKIVVTR